MPTVEVPDVGEIDFPDSMSQDEIKSVLDSKFKPKKAYATDLGIPRDPLERAARNFQEAGMASAPVDYSQKPIEFGGDIFSPVEGPGLPTVKTPPEAGALEKGAAGLYNLGAGGVNFALSPAGFATAAAPELLPAKLAAPAIKALFLGLTAKQAAQKLGEASVTGDVQDYTEAGGLGLAGGLLGANAIHEALPERVGPVQGPIAQGTLLNTPTGAVAPREEPTPPPETVNPEQAAAQLKAMNRTATAAFEPGKLPKPEVPETPPEPEISMAAEAKAERDAMIEQVRKSAATTKEQVKALFPEMNRQQAAMLRDEAWKGVTEDAIDKIKSTGGIPVEQQGVPVERPAEVEAQVGTPQRSGEGEQAVPQPAEVPKEVAPPTERGKASTSDILGFIESQADQARARLSKRGTTFGSGPLHELPNIRDYAIIGAAKIARGAVDFAKWSGDMVKEFGERIQPHLENLFSASQEVFRQHTGVVERVRQVFKEAGVPEKAITKGITGQVGRSIEAGAAAGERLTKAEVTPKLQSLTDQLNDSIPKAEALSTYFEGQQKGGAAGRKTATNELKLADRWLEADANRVRSSLTQLVQGLPMSERGRFVSAIANATKRPPLVGGDPASMYRNAAQVAARIADRMDEVQKADTINEIKDTVSKALKSPSVDIGYKSKILDAIARLSLAKPSVETVTALKNTREFLARMEAQGKDVEMPKEVLDSLEVLSKTPAKEMPLNVLEAIRDKVNMLHQLGRLKVKSRQEAWNIEKASKTQELANEKTNPLETRPEFQPQPGESQTFTQKVKNWMNRRMNNAIVFDRAILPIDALFELLGDAKGTYKGWLFKNVRNPLDLDYNAAQVTRDRLMATAEKLIKDNNMGEKEAQRIGVYAEAQQEGGMERMVAQGVKPETISKILGDITPQEKAVYVAMRKAMDSTLPEMQKLMHNLYNIDVKPVENYFPMQRAWDLYDPEPQGLKQPKFGTEMEFDDLAGWKQMLGDYMNPKTTKANRGFTLERQPGSETPIKLNAFDVFHSHINDVAYLLKTQRDLKMIGEMVRDDGFVEKYGKLGQTVVNNWLDTVARQGKVNASQKWMALDNLRRRTSAGVIGFRLASQFVHLSNVPLGIWRTGGLGWYYAGLREALSPEGQKFLNENFAETRTRGGGEPAIQEASQKSTLFGKTIIPASVNKAGFAVARGIDRYNSQAITLGIYLRLLKAKGIDINRYNEIPVDKEAQAQALVLTRRAVASPLPKDVSQQLSRGALTGGNVSIGRSLQQFQNIFQDQWSNIRVDLARAGIYEKNPRLAATAFVSLLAMGLAEMGIREASRSAINAATGYQPKHERDIPETLMLEGARRIPLGGQIASAILYGESGIPVLDSLIGLAKSIKTAATAKKPATADKAKISVAAGAAQIAGVPGASQAGELLQKAY